MTFREMAWPSISWEMPYAWEMARASPKLCTIVAETMLVTSLTTVPAPMPPRCRMSRELCSSTGRMRSSVVESVPT